jgi:hypothetical protein
MLVLLSKKKPTIGDALPRFLLPLQKEAIAAGTKFD